ncbi:hypothetical protein F5884DRAFT_7102 [Xylogone sp. PMI_703]|nr:hypothetical protein F5884DRAFT_7102 [Xylogone sp. PMI_703]
MPFSKSCEVPCRSDTPTSLCPSLTADSINSFPGSTIDGYSTVPSPISAASVEETSYEKQPCHPLALAIPPLYVDITPFGQASVIENYLHEFQYDRVLFDCSNAKVYPHGDLIFDSATLAPHRRGFRSSQYKSSSLTKDALSLDMRTLDLAPASSPDPFTGAAPYSFSETYDLQYALKYEDEAAQANYIPSNYQLEDSLNSTITNVKYLLSPTTDPLSHYRPPEKSIITETPSGHTSQISIKPKRKLLCKGKTRIKEQYNIPTNIRVQKQSQRQCPREGCGRRFQRQEHLTRHMKTHLKADTYPCLFCTKIFGRADNLKSHIKLHSFPNKKFSRTSYHPDAAHVWAMMDCKSMKRK